MEHNASMAECGRRGCKETIKERRGGDDGGRDDERVVPADGALGRVGADGQATCPESIEGGQDDYAYEREACEGDVEGDMLDKSEGGVWADAGGLSTRVAAVSSQS